MRCTYVTRMQSIKSASQDVYEKTEGQHRQTNKQTNETREPLGKGIVVAHCQSAFHIHLTRDNVIDNFSFT